MKTEFTTPHSYMDVSVKPGRDTIGPGKLGAKSAALRQYQPIFESNSKGFGCLPQVAMTPDFFSGFLGRAGASHESPAEAVAAIARTEFSSEERAAIREAFEPFTGLYAAVRSDESTSSGVGLWSSGFILMDGTEAAHARAASMVKGILISDFSRDVMAFKRRAGLPLEETPGVLVMPVDTMPLAANVLHTTPFHVNAITNFVGQEPIVQLGIGLGGANSHFARVSLLGDISDRQFRFLSNYAGEAFVFSQGKISALSDCHSHDIATMVLGMLAENAAQDPLPKLHTAFRKLRSSGNPSLYMELSFGNGQWSVVQCSDAPQFHLIERPEISGKKVLDVEFVGRGIFNIFGLNVSGRRTVMADTVVYAPNSDTPQVLAEINERTASYVLVLDHSLRVLSQKYSFADYSNAAAVISTKDNTKPAMSHFGGALREAGIVALAGDVDEGFMAEIRRRPVSRRSVLVYANDEREEGFVLDHG